jgi:hypothetical protein
MTTPELPIPAGDPEVVQPVPAGVDPITSSRIRMWALAMTAGLAAGLIGWILAESALTKGTDRLRDKGRNVPLASTVALRDAIVSFGIQGALLGLGLGATGGLIGRSGRRAVLAGGAGLILGGLAGAGTARWLVPIYFDNLNANDLTYSMEVNGGIWGAVGAAAGLAFALGLGGSGRLLLMAVAGFGGGLIAMTLFVFGGSIFLPRALADRPVSLTPESRLAARLLLTLLVAAGAVLAEVSGRKKPALADGGR